MNEWNIRNNNKTYLAAELFIQSGSASITFLQRKMCMGYPKAKEIVEELCIEGILTKYEEDDYFRYEVNINLEDFYSKYEKPNN